MEIICTIIGTAATILPGIWLIIRKLQKSAVDDYRLGKMENDVSQLARDMKDVKTDLVAVKTVLIQKHPKVTAMMTQKKSPRTLNETGKRVVEQVNGIQFLTENKDFFFEKIQAMKPKTALDVENAARFACLGYTDNDMFNGIKLYVYNAPSLKIRSKEGKEMSYDLSLPDVCYALSIPLRDMYLDAHKEIPR